MMMVMVYSDDDDDVDNDHYGGSEATGQEKQQFATTLKEELAAAPMARAMGRRTEDTKNIVELKQMKRRQNQPSEGGSGSETTLK